MFRVRTAIVDDEPLARRGIKARLARWPQFEVVAEAGDARAGLLEIERQQPHVLFLDIEMPEGDGFTLLQRMRRTPRPIIVFVTAHDDRALAAFRAEAFDYLLKPIDDARFDRTAERIVALLARRDGALDRLVIRDQGLTIALDLASIDWIRSDGDYVRIHAGRQTYLHHTTLASLGERLSSRFARIHRTTIVNLDRVQSLETLTNGDASVRLTTGVRLRASRTYRRALLLALNERSASS